MRKKTLANTQTEIVTKAAVESVLTGAITSHTHSYLPLSGGTLSGRLNINGRTYTPITDPTSQNLVLNGPDYDAAQVITEATSPGIGFHWPNRDYANFLYDGVFKFMNYNFTGYSNVRASAFVKSGSSSSYVLLGDGTHKL